MRILGISAFHRDAAAAIVVDGKPVAALQEERFTRKRLDPDFPKRAIRACLDQAKVEANELDRVVFYEKPLRKFERVLASQMRAFPRSSRVFSRSMFVWLGDRLWVRNRLATELGLEPEMISFVEQPMSHAGVAYYTSPFDEAAILVLDDVGEWGTTLLAKGQGASIEILAELPFPHSLGLFASAITQFLGFEPGADESLVEALASFGETRFKDQLGQLIRVESGGALRLDPEPFRFLFDEDVLFSKPLLDLLGEHRKPSEPLRMEGADKRDADVAASLQHVLEERALELCKELQTRSGSKRLCLAGALANNGRLVARLIADGPFDEVHVPDAMGKQGAALGAALFAHHAEPGAVRSVNPSSFDLGGTLPSLPEEGAQELDSTDAATSAVVERLARGELVAWARGSLEFGPRTLRSRVVLAAPDSSGAAGARLLTALQRAEPFLRPSVLVPLEQVNDYFVWPLVNGSVAPSALMLEARDKLREQAPDAVAPDGLVSVQPIARETDPELHAVLQSLSESNGAPLLFADTFNLRGAPVVRSELDAVDAFRRSRLDALLVDDRLYTSS